MTACFGATLDEIIKDLTGGKSTFLPQARKKEQRRRPGPSFSAHKLLFRLPRTAVSSREPLSPSLTSVPGSRSPPFLVLHRDKAVLRPRPPFLPKVVSAFHLNEDIVLPSLCPKPVHRKERALHCLDVVRALRVYLEATAFRETDSLFVLTGGPRKGRATAATVSRLICAVVVQAYAVKGQPPNSPESLSVDAVDDTSLSLRWKAPEKEGTYIIDGYLLEYQKEGSSDWVAVNKEPSISTHYKITNLTTNEKILPRVSAVSKAGSSAPEALEHFVLVREIVDRPKIRLPRNLRQTFVRQVGEAVNLVIPFQGKPKPQVIWTKNGQPLDPKQASVRNSESDTILFIRKAERKDSGTYEVLVKIDDLQDKAKIDIQIAERPGPPKSIKLVDVWGFNAALEWTPPQDNGNAEITGYTVQKSDKKTGEWFTVLENYRQLNCTISDLIIGNSYFFRVFAENLCGLSEKAATTKDAALVKKQVNTYKPPEYKDCALTEAPKFTQPPNDRTTTHGYTTKLVCSVRGSPKPKVVWMKNQMEIREDPKFRSLVNQGVCSLEIRKPSPFDGGVYTCKAINSLGEAKVECRLNVKVPQL
ncbi:PREDICTED: myosin-binding protein H-like [Nanorana parkeri]|uniref:myosin-binding protein H-like n=1 Tax=Nanorana parkeri TaxID=125878 RepID=UPI000854C438|nr:PREDICTED: myosin-binding protein H-like [Nanorana parkeri]